MFCTVLYCKILRSKLCYRSFTIHNISPQDTRSPVPMRRVPWALRCRPDNRWYINAYRIYRIYIVYTYTNIVFLRFISDNPNTILRHCTLIILRIWFWICYISKISGWVFSLEVMFLMFVLIFPFGVIFSSNKQRGFIIYVTFVSWRLVCSLYLSLYPFFKIRFDKKYQLKYLFAAHFVFWVIAFGSKPEDVSL